MKFTTIENVVDQKAVTLLNALRSIKSVYANRNIFIKTLCTDNKFKVLRDTLGDKGLTLNTTAANEHVPQIERQIKVVMEQVCSTWKSLPYHKLPNRIISCIVENALFWINALPVNIRMSCTISPRTLLMGTTIDFKKHCRI